MTRMYAPENWMSSPLDDPNAQLRGGRCASCRRIFMPALSICPGCLGTAMTGVALSRTGTLYSYSVVRTASKQFDAPYAIAYVDLPDGVRVFGHLDGWREGDVALDSTVELYAGPIGRDRDGSALVSLRFRPAAGGVR